MAKKLLLRNLDKIFHTTRSSPYWEKVKTLPIILRYIVWGFLIIFWLLGMLTPIPAGIVFFCIWLALFIWLHRVRIWVMRVVHFTRLHILYGKAYVWWQMRKR